MIMTTQTKANMVSHGTTETIGHNKHNQKGTPERGTTRRQPSLVGQARTWDDRIGQGLPLKTSLSGGCEEELDNCIGIYDTLAQICEVRIEYKLQALSKILKGDALSYF